MQILDRLGRRLRSLRISVTDRCNLRCLYCMPEPNYRWLPRSDVLSFEEIGAIAEVFLALGVDRLRITGGEPLQRTDLDVLIRILAGLDGLHDLALTTNGVSLADHAVELRAAGLHRLTVSLDTLKPERFFRLSGRDVHGHVMAGIDAALHAGFVPLKIDAVVIRGHNEDELGALIAFGRSIGAEVRFIEYMDVAGATRWSPSGVVSRDEMLQRITHQYGPIEEVGDRGSQPAERFRLADGTVFGIIASMTQPFCGDCDRGRLTADGTFYSCLYADAGADLRGVLRGGATPRDLLAVLKRIWSKRDDRGADERFAGVDRGPLIPVEALRRDPRLEMHSRGG